MAKAKTAPPAKRDTGRVVGTLLARAAKAARAPKGKATGSIHIAVADIEPSPTNPRKTFSQRELEELAASIRRHGVLQPVLVRVVSPPRDGIYYQLVIGERRWRASKLAEKEFLPACVVELTDQEVRELQLIENDQREDIGDLERAAGYRELMQVSGLTVDQVAERVGKSASTIRDYLRLADLPKIALDALADGRLPRTQAQLIARVGGEDNRRLLTFSVLWGDELWDEAEASKHVQKQIAEGTYAAMSVRDTKDLIERRYQRQLKGACFSQDDADLAGEPTCKSCPKRAGNMPESGLRADVCTDVSCYQRKCEAYVERISNAAKDAGQKVLPVEKAKKLFTPGGMLVTNTYEFAEAPCYRDAKGRTYKELLGAKLQDDLVLASDHEGKLRELYPANRVKDALDELGIGKSNGRASNGSNGSHDSWRKEQEANERKAARRRRAAALVCAAVAQDVEALAAQTTGWPNGAGPKIKLLVRAMIRTLNFEIAARIAKRHGHEERKDASDFLHALADSQTRISESLGLLADLIAGQISSDWCNWYGDGPRKEDREWLRGFGLSWEELLEQTKIDAKANGKAKRKAATK
jgi:ParB/RepB/Spo0J family partition protein